MLIHICIQSKKARQTWQKPDFGDVLNLHQMDGYFLQTQYAVSVIVVTAQEATLRYAAEGRSFLSHWLFGDISLKAC